MKKSSYFCKWVNSLIIHDQMFWELWNNLVTDSIKANGAICED